MAASVFQRFGPLVALLAACCLALAGCSGSDSSAAKAANYRLETFASTTGVRETLLVPRRGAKSLVLFMHGLQSNAREMVDDSNFAGLRNALIDAGYAIASSDAGGDNAGSQSSVDDQVRLLADARRRLQAIGHIDVLAFSMGGLDALLVAADHDIPGLQAVALISPVTDQRPFMASFRSVAEHAFSATGSALTALIDRNDPVLRNPTSFAGYRYAFWHSYQDTTVPRQQSVDMVAHLKLGGITAPLHTISGKHGDLSHFPSATVLQLFGAA